MQDWHWAMILLTPVMFSRITRQWHRTWFALMWASIAANIDPESLWANLAIDIIAGGIVMVRPAGDAQKAVAFCLGAMAIIDMGAALANPTYPGRVWYWHMQNTFGWLEWAVLAAWGAHGLGLGQAATRAFRPLWNRVAIRAHIQ